MKAIVLFLTMFLRDVIVVNCEQFVLFVKLLFDKDCLALSTQGLRYHNVLFLALQYASYQLDMNYMHDAAIDVAIYIAIYCILVHFS